MKLQLLSLGMFAFVLLGAQARAADWYVDAVHGNDANSGASSTTAWKTLTWSLAQAPAGPQTIHVLPGVYDAALGEVFPLSPKPRHAIVGEGALSTIIVDATGVPDGAFSFVSLYGGDPNYPPSTRLEHLTIVGGWYGVIITAFASDINPTLRDLDVTGQQYALSIAVGRLTTEFGSSTVLIERVHAHDADRGLVCSSSDNQPCTLTVRDSSFVSSIQEGVKLSASHGMQVTFERVRIEGNGSDGVRGGTNYYGGSLTATFRDCSLSGNGGYGWAIEGSSYGNTRTVSFERCTLAHNAMSGLHAVDDCGLNVDDVSLDQCILAGHVDDIFDVMYCGAVSVTNSCIADGSFAGSNGNFAADPLFVNPAAGDFRLQFGSPCIDLAPSSSTLDALGHARNVDGDLDTIERADIGAFEHRPLEFRGTAQIGTLAQWELWGPQGAPTTLYWTRVALASSPQSTPFGDLDLVPSATHIYRVTSAGSSAATVLHRSIPNAASLVGQTFAFQSLTNSAAAPNGKAYSNPVQFTIVP